MAGGRIATGTGSRQAISLSVRIEEDRASEEFRQARRGINSAIRGVMVQVGEREVLPTMKSDMATMLGQRWAGSLFVQRERSGVFIGSRMRGGMNRALGWLDFGGRRPRDNSRRTGPHVIVKTLDRKRDHIDEAVLKALMDEFDGLTHVP